MGKCTDKTILKIILGNIKKAILSLRNIKLIKTTRELIE